MRTDTEHDAGEASRSGPGGVAIRCVDVWKSYRIYRHHTTSLKERVLKRRSHYDEFWALKGVNLEVGKGATLGIVGPNGSGKSTFLKTLGRILTPNKGTVQTFGTVSSLLELGTGFHPELPGRENVYLAGSMLGHKRKAIDAMYGEIVDFAGIADFMDLPVKDLSSGMQARLAFAVAISVDPDILLLDEVLAVGDESFQARCYDKIAAYRSAGKTIVLVSHSLDAIRSYCDEAIWLDHGEVRAYGDSRDVVAKYLGEVHAQAAGQTGPSSSGERFGTMEAQITQVQLLDGGGQPRTSFRTNDPFTIRMRYRATRPIADASCGISIYRASNLAHMFGQNTHQYGIPLTLQGEGVIDFAVPHLPLLKGNYSLTVALHDKPVKHIYDWHERQYSFYVHENPSLPRAGGMALIPGQWNIDGRPPEPK